MKVTLRQLEVFLSVTRTGSVSRSAEELLLSQSAVSMSLSELERLLGGELFDRPGKKLILNDRGKLLLPRAMEISDRMGEMEELLQPRPGSRNDINFRLSGRLKIAASSTTGNYLIPGIMGSFVERHPEVHLSLEVRNSAAVIQSILSFDADAGFVEGLIHDPDLEVDIWKKDSLVVFAAADHPLANKRRLKPENLENTGWIMRESGSGTKEILENALSGSIRKMTLLLELGNTEAVKSAVESSRAISCLSRITIARDLESGRFVELKTPFLNLERNFYLVMHRDKYRTALLQSFLEFASS